MSESPIKSMVRKHFIETGLMFLDWWIEQFPDASVVEDQKVKLSGVVKGNVDREIGIMRAWHDGMSVPLTHKSIKYASALKRILKDDGNVYHACEYKDVQAFTLTVDVEMLKDLNLNENLDSRPDCKEQFWIFMNQMNRFCMQYFDVQFVVPSRTEIQENIRMHKALKMPSKPAMLRGFDATIDEVCTSLNVRVDKYADKNQIWMDAMKKNANFKKACEERDLEAVRGMFSSGMIADLFNCNDALYTDDVWSKIDQMFNYMGVHTSIPDKMMGRIESTAHKLAGDIAMGKADLSTLNLSEIGQSVLEGCDTSDMEQFTQNMGNLLPVLQNLQENVAGNLPRPSEL